MHKSTTIGLFLIVSLLVGTAATNMQMFVSNAVAQEYGQNAYSSDSYSDRYSEYKTKDNKYVCQTGPFEGFYVESVEWCEVKKFDDDKKFDDKVKRGPPGPPGPPGIVNAELCPPETDLENVYVLTGTTEESCNLVITCDDCIESILTPDELTRFEAYLAGLLPQFANNLAEYCELLDRLDASGITIAQIRALILPDFNAAQISEAQLDRVIECLIEIGFLSPP